MSTEIVDDWKKIFKELSEFSMRCSDSTAAGGDGPDLHGDHAAM
jgi:hypothetical protein